MLQFNCLFLDAQVTKDDLIEKALSGVMIIICITLFIMLYMFIFGPCCGSLICSFFRCLQCGNCKEQRRKGCKLEGIELPKMADIIERFNENKEKAICMIIMILWLIYPDICHVMFSSISCIEKEGVYRLYRDLEVICWEKEHLKFFSYNTLPGFLLWVIGLPLTLFYFIRKNREFLTIIDKKDYSEYD